jgi:hypothetical protein
VPFGPGPYGVSQSWFFDQHYYVGLSDDMDLGVKYIKPLGNLTLDLAYCYSDEGNYSVGNKAGYGAPAGLPYFTSNRFGANPTDDWEYRVNINLGYYFHASSGCMPF